MRRELEKRAFLIEQVGADRLDLSALPPNRRAWLAQTGRQSTNQALAPTDIACSAIIVWNTVYTQRVLEQLRADGELITTSEIEHISPMPHQHIHAYGHYPFDLASRPHRLPATASHQQPSRETDQDAEQRLT